MRRHTGLFPTDSLPNFLQVELIHRLLLKGGFILWVAPIKELFHLMSNTISLDNQTFIAWYVDSFINFFQSQNFYLSFISQRKYGIRRGGGWNSGSWGLEVSVFWEGQPVGAQLTLVQYVHLKKQLNPADAFF